MIFLIILTSLTIWITINVLVIGRTPRLTVEITHANHHAAGDKATKTYTVTNVHVTFGLADTNNDGSVGPDDLKVGDQVKVIGKITALAKKCNQSGFTATTTIRKVVFKAPVTPGS